MRKYLCMFSCELRRSLVYRGQALLMGPLSLCKVVLAGLLWRAVIGGGESFGGFTLPAITTYYLLAGALGPLCNNFHALTAFSEEIKEGGFSKYLVRPMSPMGCYLASSLGQALFRTLAGMAALGLVLLAAPGYFQPLRGADLLAALPVVALAALLGAALCYLVALLTFRLTDIGFLIAFQEGVLLFLSGATLPLNLLLGERGAMLLPFSYLLYYPVMLMMGRAGMAASTAALIMSGWLAALLALGSLLGRRARGLYEGVGM